MADSRTAITCPKHPSCVVLIDACLKQDLQGRTRLNHPMWMQPWVDHNGDRIVVAITHVVATPDPDVLLTSAVADERDHASLRRRDKELEDRIVDLERSYVKVLANLSVEAGRSDRLEAFSTRRKRWRKEWDREEGTQHV